MTAQPKQFVILGAGTGGTLAANRLRKKFDESELTIDVDRSGQRSRLPTRVAVCSIRFGRSRRDRSTA